MDNKDQNNEIEKEKLKKKKTRFYLFSFFFIVFVSYISFLFYNENKSKKVNYSQFIKYLNDNKITYVSIINKDNIRFNIEVNGIKKELNTLLPYPDLDLLKTLKEKNINFNGTTAGLNMDLIISLISTIVLIAFILIFLRQIKERTSDFVKLNIDLVDKADINITFEDVAGQEEVKEDLKEMIDFLNYPDKFKKMGAKIPRGVLLTGPPGTGKTLLAKAIAGESNVNFMSISGSNFVEMFVGVGAGRVRSLFKKAKENAPCIIFIDELDAVAKRRVKGDDSGARDEKDQTLNQILVEMDGFDSHDTVIVVGATNRVEVLDEAILRPGRFDRKINVAVPDILERELILKLHAKKTYLDESVDLKKIAKMTTSFSGADLKNVINESILFAIKNDCDKVDMNHLDEAVYKIIMGNTRKSNFKAMSDKLKKETAYHEIGHTILHYLLDTNKTFTKVTIIPRGQALGLTVSLPHEDNSYTLRKNEILNDICILYGGYAVEKLIFDDTSAGVSNDLKRATYLATKMVCDWGMSDLGAIYFDKDNEGGFSLKDNFSQQSSADIDKAIKKILKDCYDITEKLLKNNIDKVHLLSKELIEKETLTDEDIKGLLYKKTLEIEG